MNANLLLEKPLFLVGRFSHFRFIFRTGERLQNLRRNNRMQNVLWYGWKMLYFSSLFLLYSMWDVIRTVPWTIGKQLPFDWFLLYYVSNKRETVHYITSLKRFMVSYCMTFGLVFFVYIDTILLRMFIEKNLLKIQSVSLAGRQKCNGWDAQFTCRNNPLQLK